MENKGIEFTLNTVNVSTKTLRWTTNINVARNENKMVKLDGEQTANTYPVMHVMPMLLLLVSQLVFFTG